MTHQHRPWGYSNSADGDLPDWDLHEETLAVRAGLARSGFGETGEARAWWKPEIVLLQLLQCLVLVM